MTIGNELKQNFPNTLDKDDSVFKSLVANENETGALEKVLNEVDAYCQDHSTNYDIYAQEGELLELSNKFFTYLEQFTNESEENLKNRIASIFVRKGDKVWGTPQDVINVFKNYFPTGKIYLCENTALTSDENQNLIKNGDFQENTNWVFSSEDIRTRNARFTRSFGVEMKPLAFCEQTFDISTADYPQYQVRDGDTYSSIAKFEYGNDTLGDYIKNYKNNPTTLTTGDVLDIPPRNVYFLHFFLKGVVRLRISSGNDNNQYDFDTNTFGGNHYKVFETEDWQNISVPIITTKDNSDIRIKFSDSLPDVFYTFENTESADTTVYDSSENNIAATKTNCTIDERATGNCLGMVGNVKSKFNFPFESKNKNTYSFWFKDKEELNYLINYDNNFTTLQPFTYLDRASYEVNNGKLDLIYTKNSGMRSFSATLNPTCKKGKLKIGFTSVGDFTNLKIERRGDYVQIANSRITEGYNELEFTIDTPNGVQLVFIKESASTDGTIEVTQISFVEDFTNYLVKYNNDFTTKAPFTYLDRASYEVNNGKLDLIYTINNNKRSFTATLNPICKKGKLKIGFKSIGDFTNLSIERLGDWVQIANSRIVEGYNELEFTIDTPNGVQLGFIKESASTDGTIEVTSLSFNEYKDFTIFNIPNDISLRYGYNVSIAIENSILELKEICSSLDFYETFKDWNLITIIVNNELKKVQVYFGENLIGTLYYTQERDSQNTVEFGSDLTNSISCQYDNIMCFNRLLSSEEISNIYNNTSHNSYLDYVRFYKKEKNPSFTIIAHFEGNTTQDALALADGSEDTEITTKYNNYGYFDDAFFTGVASGFAQDIYEDLINYVRSQGVKAYIEVLNRDE